MPDRGEPSTTRSALIRTPLVLAVGSVTGALLVAAPGPANGSGDALPSAESLTGVAGASRLAGGPDVVRPRVQDLAIPAAPDSASLRLSAPQQIVDEHGTLMLAAHLSAPDVDDFSMLGVTWDSTVTEHVTTQVRTLTGGNWTVWTDLHVDADEGPASESREAGRDGTPPLWVDDSSGVEVRVYTESGQPPSGLEVNAIDPGSSTHDAAAPEIAEATAAASAEAASSSGGFPKMPPIITRRQWGADPSLGDRCWPPRYGKTFKNVFVHHTVSSNDYSESESPGIVRGIYAYHTQSRGWCDIGYNFLVDRYGNVFEGRRGGIRKPVRGAHAGDYNTNSTGISLIGNFEEVSGTKRMKRGLVSLVAWRMGTAYKGAHGHPRINGERFRRISGHRDAMSTACPGQHIYDWLPRLRKRVANRLGDYQSPIESRWRDSGRSGGRFGVVRIGERGVTGGHVTVFAKGRGYSSEGVARLHPKGPVLRRFLNVGGTQGKFGFPTSAIRRVAHGTGKRAVYEGGRIFWSSDTRARAFLNGPILHRYLTVRGPRGRLGFPTREPYVTSSGARADFQHGYIIWTRSTRRTTVNYT